MKNMRFLQNVIPIFAIGTQFVYNKIYCKSENIYDMAIVGGGIVGIATAYNLSLQFPTRRIVVVEKEKELFLHQTSHNSGVIHAGLYYKPQSKKALLCVEGAKLAYEFCDSHSVPYEKVGKIIVARNEQETKQLRNIHENATHNGVTNLYWKTKEDLRSLIPSFNAEAGLLSMNTGIISWKQFATKIKDIFLKSSLNHIETDFQVCEIQKDKTVFNIKSSKGHLIKSKNIIACCGVHSDTIAKILGIETPYKMLPIRGEYLKLKDPTRFGITTNIYPVPNPEYPFLGVHFTPTIHGDILIGPNAVLAFAKKGYKYTDISVRDIVDYIASIHFWRMILQHYKFGINEITNSIIIHKKIKELQTYIPSLQHADVEYGMSGVRGQCIDENGNFVKDFIYDTSKDNVLVVVNAPSPGATACLSLSMDIIKEFLSNNECFYDK